ncbi:MAG: hypothetical protein ACOCXM_00235 [Myxococcota bacterium]
MGRTRAAPILPLLAALATSLVGCGGSTPPDGSTSAGDATRAGEPSGAETPAQAGPAATAPGEDPTPTDSQSPPPSDWPDRLVAGPGTGPALFVTGDDDAPAVGYVSPGVAFEVTGAPEGTRVPVRIDGPLEVRAWLTTERLAGRVQERGRVGQAPGYVGPNDVVRILGDGGDGLLRIELRPPLREDHELPPMEAVYPAERIGAQRVDLGKVKGPSPGTPVTLPSGETVQVYDRPDGDVVATLPNLDPPLTLVRLVEKGAWSGVRVGTGPYLVGFVNVPLTSASEPPRREEDPLAHPTSASDVPLRLQTEPDQPLRRVAVDTPVRFNGRTVAVVRKPALAREMVRHETTGQVDVFVAADDGVAVRGMVPDDALEDYRAPGSGDSM